MADDGLAYRLVPVDNSVRLEWEPEPVVGLAADDAFGPPESDSEWGGGRGSTRGPQPVKRAAAAKWLVAILKDGPRLKAEIDAAAKAAGWSAKTIRNAGEALGLERRM